MTGPAPAPAPQATPTSNAPAGSAAAKQPPGATDTRATATGPPGSDSSAPAFASVLHDQVARTALAEGQKETGEAPAGGRDPHQPGVDVNDQTVAAASVLQAIANGDAVKPTPLAGPLAAGQAAAVQAGASTDPAGAVSPDPRAPAVAATAATTASLPASASALPGNLPAAGSGPAQPAPATAQPQPATGTATPATPATAVAQAAPVQTPSGAAEAKPAAASVTPPATAAHAAQAAGHPATDAQPAPAAGSSSTAVGVQTAGASTDQSAAQGDPRQAFSGQTTQPASQPAASTSQPASTPSPTFATVEPSATPVSAPPAAAPATAPHAGVGLDHAVETVRMTIELASRQGYSQARIQLSPPELGDIRIHLQQTADGLVARVVAEHASAVQALQHGGAELRRSLEAAGLPLLRLDIESSEQRGPGAQDSGGTGPGATRDEAGGNELQEPSGDEPVTTKLTVSLPTGAVVDVLA